MPLGERVERAGWADRSMQQGHLTNRDQRSRLPSFAQRNCPVALARVAVTDGSSRFGLAQGLSDPLGGISGRAARDHPENPPCEPIAH
jgi:hypothetical protein